LWMTLCILTSFWLVSKFLVSVPQIGNADEGTDNL
jgi:hypothetical protein